MKYRSDDGTEEEILWNSRDGVTPFAITLRSGKPATHVEWSSDVCNPDHIPKPGDRIFIDLTYERALEYALNNLAHWRSEGLDMTGAPTAMELAGIYTQHAGAPDIVEVT